MNDTRITRTLDEVTQELVNLAQRYTEDNEDSLPKKMKQQIQIQTQAKLLDHITNSDLGTQMWAIFEFERHTDDKWNEKIWKLLELYKHSTRGNNG